MIQSTRIVAACLIAASPVLIGAAKPSQAPFVPAIAYKYNTQDIRLANADGSQATLLVREPTNFTIGYLALAPVGKRQVAFVEFSNGGVTRSLRLANWTQTTPGGPLTVSVDPRLLLTTQGSGAPGTGMALYGVDYSPDGTRIAVISTDLSTSELRLFDSTTGVQVGDTVSIPVDVSNLSWWSSNHSILLRGASGMYSVNIATGQFEFLFGGVNNGPFDAFNGSSTDVVIPYSDPNAPVRAIYRWDGVSMSNGQPVFSTVVPDGIFPSISCDNSKMLFIQISPKRIVYNLTLATGVKQEFSRDNSITRLAYPNSCA